MYGSSYLAFLNFGLVFTGDFVSVTLGHMWDCIGVGHVAEGRHNTPTAPADIHFCPILPSMETNKTMLVTSVIFFWYHFRDVNINFKIPKTQDPLSSTKPLSAPNLVITWIIRYQGYRHHRRRSRRRSWSQVCDPSRHNRWGRTTNGDHRRYSFSSDRRVA